MKKIILILLCLFNITVFKAENIKIVIYVTNLEMQNKAEILKNNICDNNYEVVIIQNKDSNIIIQYRCSKTNNLLGIFYSQDIPQLNILIQYAIISENVLNNINKHKEKTTFKNTKKKNKLSNKKYKYKYIKKKKRIKIK
jgi:hypothetical protein